MSMISRTLMEFNLLPTGGTTINYLEEYANNQEIRKKEKLSKKRQK